jgi:hypothetical protein
METPQYGPPHGLKIGNKFMIILFYLLLALLFPLLFHIYGCMIQDNGTRNYLHLSLNLNWSSPSPQPQYTIQCRMIHLDGYWQSMASAQLRLLIPIWQVNNNTTCPFKVVGTFLPKLTLSCRRSGKQNSFPPFLKLLLGAH